MQNHVMKTSRPNAGTVEQTIDLNYSASSKEIKFKGNETRRFMQKCLLGVLSRSLKKTHIKCTHCVIGLYYLLAHNIILIAEVRDENQTYAYPFF